MAGPRQGAGHAGGDLLESLAGDSGLTPDELVQWLMLASQAGGDAAGVGDSQAQADEARRALQARLASLGMPGGAELSAGGVSGMEGALGDGAIGADAGMGVPDAPSWENPGDGELPRVWEPPENGAELLGEDFGLPTAGAGVWGRGGAFLEGSDEAGSLPDYVVAMDRVQPMVHRVLDPSSTREILSASLSDLKSCLESFSPSAAQACASYVALGLVFLIDNATAKTSDREQAKARPGPAAVDAALQCLETLFCKRWRAEGAASTLLQRLGAVIEADRDWLGEHARLAALRVMAALLGEGQGGGTEGEGRRGAEEDPGEDLLDVLAAPLQFGNDALARHATPSAPLSLELTTDSAMPVVGFALSALLQCAVQETELGRRGSPEVRRASLRVARRLIVAVDSADVTAAFLPGTVSGLTRVIVAATGGVRPSAAPAELVGKEAVAEALTTLSRALTCTLGSEALPGAVLREVWEQRGEVAASGGASQAAEGMRGDAPGQEAGDGSMAAALQALQGLALGEGRAKGVEGSSAAGEGRSERGERGRGDAAGGDGSGAGRGKDGAASLVVTRDASWVMETTKRIATCLGMVVPRGTGHPSRRVRRAAAEMCGALLRQCPVTLAPSAPLLLGALLTLCSDSDAPVAAAAAAAVRGLRVFEGQPHEVAAKEEPRDKEGTGAGDEDNEWRGGEVADVLADDGLFPGLDFDVKQLLAGSEPGIKGHGDSQASGKDPADAEIDVGMDGEVGVPMADREGDEALGAYGAYEDMARELLGAGDVDGDDAELGWGAGDSALGHSDRKPGVGGPRASDAPVPVAAAASAKGGAAAWGGVAGQAVPWLVLCGMMEEMWEAMPKAALGSADAVEKLCGRLAAAMRVAGARRISEAFLADPVRAGKVLRAVERTLVFDASTAALLLHSTPDPGTWAALRSGHAGDRFHTEGADAAPPATAGAPRLPRMPPGLLYLHTKSSYAALAHVLRCLGRAGALAARPVGQARGVGLPKALPSCRKTPASAAGSEGLAALHDALLTRLSGAMTRGRSQSADVGGLAGGAPWQCTAATWVVAMAEVIHGASAAWEEDTAVPWSDTTGIAGAGDVHGVERVQVSSVGLEAMGAAFVGAMFGEDGGVQELATSAAGPTEGETDDPPPPPLSAHALGLNALVLRVCLEACGALARSIGPAFLSHARLLPACLLPMVERIDDPSSAVAGAARAALAAVCAAGGHGSLRALLSANADFVVDRVCARIRAAAGGASRGRAGPSPAQLLASLLGASGAAPDLLPLLAEPAQAAMRGVAVRMRAARFEDAALYLEALLHVARGAEGEARRVREEAEGGDKGRGDGSSLGSPDMPSGERGGGIGVTGSVRVAMARRRTTCVACAKLATAVVDACGPLAVSTSPRTAVAAMEACEHALAALSDAGRAHAADRARQESMVGSQERGPEVVGPSEEVPQLLPSVHALWYPLAHALRGPSVAGTERALSCLAHAAAVSDGAFLARRMATEAWPAVRHLLAHGAPMSAGAGPAEVGAGLVRGPQWSFPAKRGAKSSRQSLQGAGGGHTTLESLAVTDSSLSTRRDGEGSGHSAEGLSTAMRALRDAYKGAATASAALPGHPAPGTALRLRVAALQCLRCLAEDTTARPALRHLAPRIIDEVSLLLDPSGPPRLREAAVPAWLAVAKLDPDAAWGLLADVCMAVGEALPGAARGGKGPAMAAWAGEGRSVPTRQCSSGLARALAFLDCDWRYASHAGRGSKGRASALAAAVVDRRSAGSKAAGLAGVAGVGGLQSGDSKGVDGADTHWGDEGLGVEEDERMAETLRLAGKEELLHEDPWEWPVARGGTMWPAPVAAVAVARTGRLLPEGRALLPRFRAVGAGDASEGRGLSQLIRLCAERGVAKVAPALAKRVEEWVEALWVASVAVGDEWGDAAAAGVGE